MRKRQTKNSQSERVAKIPTDWLIGLEESSEEFEKTWRNSTYVLDRLKGIIDREVAQLYIDLDSDYEVPNWALLRADKNGRIRALEKIRKLLP